jgi:hypothetical protein
VTDERPELFDQAVTEAEVLDAVPVLADARARPLAAGRPAGMLSPGVVQTVAVVGVGVAAGAASVAILHRRRARRLARSRRRMLAPILASRSFLIDVHVLGERNR